MKPEDRYPSARQLASEIELWLADEPVAAYPEPVTQRLWRWTRRNKGLVGTGVSACVALVTVVVGAWIVNLEREIATREKLGASQVRATSLQDQGSRFYKLDHSVRANLDQMAAQIDRDPRLHRPELQTLRKELLLQLLAFWDEPIRIDASQGPGWRTDFYHLQQALCLARLGEHQRAAEVARSVESAATSTDSSGLTEIDLAKAYDLARVYAVCATVTKNNGGMAEQYGDRAMKHLRAAAAAGYFKEAARAQRLREDRDLDFLRPREDFGKLLREVEPKL